MTDSASMKDCATQFSTSESSSERMVSFSYRGHAFVTAPDYRSAWLDAPDERFDDPWGRTTSGNALMGVRDMRSLRWRKAARPADRRIK